MCPSIKVRLAPKTYVPTAAVPLGYIWELAEYLACRGTKVQYSYGPTHCEVLFPTLDGPAAQRILDDWATWADADLCARGSKKWRSDVGAAGMVKAARYTARARG